MRKSKVRMPGSGDLPPPAEDEILVSGALRLDPLEQRVSVGEQALPLPPKVYELLLVLLHEPQRVHSRDALFARLWPNSVLLDANLTTTVSQLRKALGEDGRNALRTVPRFGYSWDAPVLRVARSSSPFPAQDPGTALHSPDASPTELPRRGDDIGPDIATAAQSQPVASEAGLAGKIAAPQSGESWPARRVWPMVAAALAVLLALSGWWHWSAEPQAPKRYVLLLQSPVLTGVAEEQAWMADALADALAQTLRLSPHVRVLNGEGPAATIAAQGPLGSADGADGRLHVAVHPSKGKPGTYLLRLHIEDADGRDHRWTATFRASDLVLAGQNAAKETLSRLFDGDRPLALEVIVPEALEAYEEGVAAEARGDHAAATAAYQRAVGHSPAFSMARMRLAGEYERLFRNDLAAAQWRAVAAMQSGLSEESREVAQAKARIAEGDFSGAAELYRGLAMRYADEPNYLIERIENLLRAGGDKLPVAELELASAERIARTPGERLGLAMLAAQLARARGQLDRESEAYRRVLELTERLELPLVRGNAHFQLGVLSKNAGDVAAARREFSHAMRLFREAGSARRAEVVELNMLLLPQQPETSHSELARAAALTEFARRAMSQGYSYHGGQALAVAAIVLSEQYQLEAATARAHEAEEALRTQDAASRALPQIALVSAELRGGRPASALRRLAAIEGIPEFDANRVLMRVWAEMEQGRWRDAQASLERAETFWKSEGLGEGVRQKNGCVRTRLYLGLGDLDASSRAWHDCAKYIHGKDTLSSMELRITEAELALRRGEIVRVNAVLSVWRNAIAAETSPSPRMLLQVLLAEFLIGAGRQEEAYAVQRSIHLDSVSQAPAPMRGRYWLNEALLSGFLEDNPVRVRRALIEADAAIPKEHALQRDELRLLQLVLAGPKESSGSLARYIQLHRANGASLAVRRAEAALRAWRSGSGEIWRDPIWWNLRPSAAPASSGGE